MDRLVAKRKLQHQQELQSNQEPQHQQPQPQVQQQPAQQLNTHHNGVQSQQHDQQPHQQSTDDEPPVIFTKAEAAVINEILHSEGPNASTLLQNAVETLPDQDDTMHSPRARDFGLETPRDERESGTVSKSTLTKAEKVERVLGIGDNGVIGFPDDMEIDLDAELELLEIQQEQKKQNQSRNQNLQCSNCSQNNPQTQFGHPNQQQYPQPLYSQQQHPQSQQQQQQQQSQNYQPQFHTQQQPPQQQFQQQQYQQPPPQQFQQFPAQNYSQQPPLSDLHHSGFQNNGQQGQMSHTPSRGSGQQPPVPNPLQNSPYVHSDNIHPGIILRQAQDLPEPPGAVKKTAITQTRQPLSDQGKARQATKMLEAEKSVNKLIHGTRARMEEREKQAELRRQAKEKETEGK